MVSGKTRLGAVLATLVASGGLPGALAQDAAPEEPAAAPPAPNFSLDDAAWCAQIYAYTHAKMQGAPNVPVAILRRMSDGIAIWEYELNLWAQSEPREALESAALRAHGYVRSRMPDGASADNAAARGDFLVAAAKTCEESLVVAYEGAVHPVVPLLRAEEMAARMDRAGQQGSVDAADAADKARRGFR